VFLKISNSGFKHILLCDHKRLLLHVFEDRLLTFAKFLIWIVLIIQDGYRPTSLGGESGGTPPLKIGFRTITGIIKTYLDSISSCLKTRP